MEDQLAKKTSRREFVGQVGMGIAALSTLPGARVLGADRRVIGANDTIRIGLIGAGSRGQTDLKHALKQPKVECVAIADVYSRRRNEVKGYLPKIDTYEDARRLLDRKDIDAVIVATPLHLHAKYFLASLSAGKDLYCEKTMTWNIPEAVACRKAAKASSQIVQIGMQDESSGQLADAKKWIKDGLTGKITLVDSWMSRNTPLGQGQWVRPVPADCKPGEVNWDLFLDGRPKTAFDGYKFINWRLFWEFSGGNITENMIHQIGWIISAMDLQLPAAATMMGGVFAEKDGRQVPDTIGVSLEYPNDLLVQWQSSFSNRRYGMGEHFLGRKGTIEHISDSNDMLTGQPNRVIPKYADDDMNSAGPVHYYPEKRTNPQGVAIDGTNPGIDHMADWCACIRDRNQPYASVEIGYLGAIAAHMSNLAYRQKRRITLEEAMAAPADAWM
jgi:predicted dehydrogenase